ncbi:hypothetical protein DID80_03415 [Candidatus Marinamargulisbacteria bacterium SCGC AAA071-K20]|nr:hypothetical protein DID80_03415 [Candidatus Marinamargulisbacteria bacterium SCGC AAA071-K20]
MNLILLLIMIIRRQEITDELKLITFKNQELITGGVVRSTMSAILKKENSGDFTVESDSTFDDTKPELFKLIQSCASFLNSKSLYKPLTLLILEYRIKACSSSNMVTLDNHNDFPEFSLFFPIGNTSIRSNLKICHPNGQLIKDGYEDIIFLRNLGRRDIYHTPVLDIPAREEPWRVRHVIHFALGNAGASFIDQINQSREHSTDWAWESY